MQKSLRVGGIGSEAVGRTSGLTQKKKTSWLKNQIKSLKIREAMKAENK